MSFNFPEVVSANFSLSLSVDGQSFQVDVAFSRNKHLRSLSATQNHAQHDGVLYFYRMYAEGFSQLELCAKGLSALFVSTDGIILDIKSLTDGFAGYKCANARYVIELSSAWLSVRAIQVGQTVEGLMFE